MAKINIFDRMFEKTGIGYKLKKQSEKIAKIVETTDRIVETTMALGIPDYHRRKKEMEKEREYAQKSMLSVWEGREEYNPESYRKNNYNESDSSEDLVIFWPKDVIHKKVEDTNQSDFPKHSK